ncbi:MAG: cell division protein FtsA [Candidatus Zambryskibacteria bacterium]|nr:cell division protein FtsA [Candidatus Zambryskibacteria bacterium]
MARQIVAGVDIGTATTKVIIAEKVFVNGMAVPKIIGMGTSESRGVSRGYITNTADAARSVQAATAKAEKSAGIKIKRVYASVGGVGLGGVSAAGSTVTSRADLEITERDIGLALEAAEAAIPSSISQNKKIINTVPVEYKIDGKEVWGEAQGLKGQKLEVKALFITCFEHHLSNLISTIESAGIEVADVVAAPVAASFVTLSKKQKKVGCLLADIGAETTSLVVYENNNPASLEVFPVGGVDITNDIALGLKIPLEDAENVKLDVDRRIMYSKKKLEDIISERLKEIFGLVEKHLRNIGRDGLLPGGSIITGGSAAASGTKLASEHVLKLPTQLSEIHFGPPSELGRAGNGAENKIKDRSWAIAVGLVVVGLNADDEQSSLGIRNKALAENGKRLVKNFRRWFSQFLP